MGLFGLWLRVFSAPGVVQWDLQHPCRFTIMFRKLHLHRSQVTWCVFPDLNTPGGVVVQSVQSFSPGSV